MAMTPIFRGAVRDGKFIPDHAPQYAQYMRGLNENRVEVTTRKERRTRSIPQNSYLHQIIGLWADHLGWEADDLKDALKARFLTYYPEDSPLPKIKRTRDLNTAEMTEFTDCIKRLAAEYDFRIPDPGEVEYA